MQTSGRSAAAILANSRPFASANGYPIVKFIGRVGAVPVAQELRTDSQRAYFRFPIAVTLFSKKDSEGKPVLDERGYAAKETSWLTVFSFKEGQHAQLTNLKKGAMVEIEADLIEREHRFTDGYVPSYPIRQAFYRQRELKVLDSLQ